MGTWESGKVGTGRAAATRFEQLEVWRTARELARGVYRAAKTQALAREATLRNQMLRAAISISSNIAEGYERGTRRQQIEFCYIAKGSAGELRSQLILANDFELLTQRAYDWLMAHCDKCSRQLSRYIAHLQRTQRRIRGTKFAAAEQRDGEHEE